MINFKELCPGKFEETVFIPYITTKPLCGLLKENRPDIEFKVVDHDRIRKDSEFGISRREFCRNNRHWLKSSKYEKSYPECAFDAFISKLDVSQIYSILENFYLEKEDKEVKSWIERQKNPALVKSNGDDVLILRLDCKQFKAIGEYETLTKLEKLMRKKKLTQSHVRLILETVAERTPEEAEEAKDDIEMSGLIIDDLDAFLDGNGGSVVTEDLEHPRKHVIIVEPEENNFDPPIVLPIHSKEFKIIEAKHAEDFKRLMDNKHLKEEDIKLVLDSVKLKY